MESPTSHPAPSTREPGIKLGPTRQPTFHQPQPISNSSLSLLISFLQFPRKSAPLTHTHSHNPNPPARACSKMSVCNSRDLVEGNLPVSSWADLSLPSLHPTVWCLGGLSLLAPAARQPLTTIKARMQRQSRRQPTLPFPLNSTNDMLHFTVLIGTKPQTLPPIGLLTLPLETAKTS